MNTCFYYLRISYPNSVWVKVTTCPDGWVVDKTKIMQCHLLTEVVVEVEDELGKNVALKKNILIWGKFPGLSEREWNPKTFSNLNWGILNPGVLPFSKT